MDPKELKKLIANRRSIFPNMYSDEKVDDSIIEEMLENANWAPNHKHTEPWRFTVFTGEGLKKLAEFQSSLYKKVATEAGDFQEKKFNTLANKPLKASHIIAVGMKRTTRVQLPEIEEIEAVACAVQNMYLTAAAYGLGSYWGSGGITYMEGAKSFFGLEDNDKLLGFFFVGKPKGEWPKGKRTPVSEKTTWVSEA